MARILSIETSTSVCSIALHDDCTLLGESSSNEPFSHAERLAPLIEELLAKLKINKESLEAIAVSSGPGSYTGLRIGTSTAKGLCYALDIPMITVNTLESMLRNIPAEYATIMKCPMIDARRMEVYCLLATPDSEIIEYTQAKIIDADSFTGYLAKDKILFFGNGADKCKTVIKNENAIYLDNVVPSAINIGELAANKFAQGDFADLAYFEPEYLKPFVAIKAKNPLL